MDLKEGWREDMKGAGREAALEERHGEEKGEEAERLGYRGEGVFKGFRFLPLPSPVAGGGRWVS